MKIFLEILYIPSFGTALNHSSKCMVGCLVAAMVGRMVRPATTGTQYNLLKIIRTH